jgi:methyltransferase-like protein
MSTKKQTAEQENKNPYDAVPYSSYCFSQSNPSLINSIATLFGLNAPDHKKAKILELGCASGNNIISMAALYPESKFIGIDLSSVQVNEGNKNIENSGIKNVELKCMSIMDIDEKFGKFDYIICHGVFSWVPKEIQEKILEICGKNLTKDGVAYVSYNTMPGWASVKAIREMMQYHTAKFEDPKIKATQARLLLKFINEAHGKNVKSGYSEIIENEMKLLNNQSDYYLLHDHLEENNIQYYFHEFIEMASKQGLQYLAEVSLSSMYSGNFPAETAKVLETSDDIVRTEQYMDFINNRRFRSTLLCHKDKVINRALQPENLFKMKVSNAFRFHQAMLGYNFKDMVEFKLVAPSGINITTNDKILIAAVLSMAENGVRPISIDDLMKKIEAKITSNGNNFQINQQQFKTGLCLSLLKCIFMGGINIAVDDANYKKEISDKPKTSDLAQYQATIQNWVTNQRMEPVTLNSLDKVLLPFINGKNNKKALAKNLLPKFEDGTLKMKEGEVEITDSKIIEEKISNNIDSVLNRYAQLALLVD